MSLELMIPKDYNIVDVRDSKQIDERKVKLAEYIALGYKPGEVADILGASVAWVRLCRKDPAVAKLINDLQNEAIDSAKRLIISNTSKAAQKILDLLEKSKSEHVQITAAKDILDRAGVKEKELQPSVGSITNNFNFSDLSVEELKIAIITRMKNLELDVVPCED